MNNKTNTIKKKRQSLIKARKLKGHTQEEVAYIIGISRSFYNQIETGERNPSYRTAFKISQLLSVDLTELR